MSKVLLDIYLCLQGQIQIEWWLRYGTEHDWLVYMLAAILVLTKTCSEAPFMGWQLTGVGLSKPCRIIHTLRASRIQSCLHLEHASRIGTCMTSWAQSGPWYLSPCIEPCSTCNLVFACYWETGESAIPKIDFAVPSLAKLATLLPPSLQTCMLYTVHLEHVEALEPFCYKIWTLPVLAPAQTSWIRSSVQKKSTQWAKYEAWKVEIFRMWCTTYKIGIHEQNLRFVLYIITFVCSVCGRATSKTPLTPASSMVSLAAAPATVSSVSHPPCSPKICSAFGLPYFFSSSHLSGKCWAWTWSPVQPQPG